MAIILINKFLGTAPRVAPHLLPDGMAVESWNCDLSQGHLIPLLSPKDVGGGSLVGKKTIYHYGAKDTEFTWLGYDDVVDVVRAPVSNSNHRIYWTGKGSPKARTYEDATPRMLGVPKPVAPLTVTFTPSVEPQETWETTSSRAMRVETGRQLSHIGISSAVTQFAEGTPIRLTAYIGGELNEDVYLDGTVYFHSIYDIVVDVTSIGDGDYEGEVINSWKVVIQNPDYKEDMVLKRTTGYVYTIVNAWDEESAPYMPEDLPVFSVYGYHTAVTISGMACPSAISGFFKEYRVYRISVGSGSAGFQYVGSSSSSEFVDTKEDKDLGEVCPTLTFLPPPENLHSLVSLSNGALAGAVANEIWFSEPYIPYAWPQEYKIALESNIVGLGYFGSTVVACTQTRPYIISGTVPGSMSAQQLPYDQPCLSKRGIVSTGSMVLYPSSDGLFAITDSYSGKLMTQQIMTKEQWLAESPQNFMAIYSDNQYLALRPSKTGIIFDLERGDITKVSVSLGSDAKLLGVVYSPINDRVYIKSTNKIWEWMTGESTTFSWKSKEYVMPKPTCMSCYRVRGGQGGQIRVLVDGVQVCAYTITDGAVGRLPAGNMGRRFQVILSANVPIYDVAVATSVEEIANAQ